MNIEKQINNFCENNIFTEIYSMYGEVEVELQTVDIDFFKENLKSFVLSVANKIAMEELVK